MKYVKSSEHFSKNELACKCKKTDCEAKGMNSDFIEALEKLRVQYNKGMIINSAERCVKHCIEAKKIAKGKSPGAHTKGCAVDISVTNSVDRHQLLELVYKLEFEGIGIGGTFIHIDKFAELEARKEESMTWVY